MINLQKPLMVSNEAFLERLDIPTWAINYLEYGKDETEELQPNDLALVKFFRRHWDPLEKNRKSSFPTPRRLVFRPPWKHGLAFQKSFPGLSPTLR